MNEHRNKTPIVVAPARHRFAEVDGDLFLARRQQTHERFAEQLALKQTSGFVANAFAQQLPGFDLVRFTEGLDLLVRLVRQEGDDGGFVGAHAFDGVAHGSHVGGVIDIGVIVHVRRVTLRQGFDYSLEIAPHLPLASHGADEILLVDPRVRLARRVELLGRRRHHQANNSLGVRTETSDGGINDFRV